MVTVDLDDSDIAALVALLKQAIAANPFPMSVRSKLLRGIVGKLLSMQTGARQSASETQTRKNTVEKAEQLDDTDEARGDETRGHSLT